MPLYGLVFWTECAVVKFGNSNMQSWLQGKSYDDANEWTQDIVAIKFITTFMGLCYHLKTNWLVAH